jgi:alkylation response protein AidB-like acyl-CoA dehydrogenase
MAVRIEGARWLTYKSAIEFDRGRMHSGSLLMAQLEARRRLMTVVDEALQIFRTGNPESKKRAVEVLSRLGEVETF